MDPVELAGVVLIGEIVGVLSGEAIGAKSRIIGTFLGEATEDGLEKVAVGFRVGVFLGVDAKAAIADLDFRAGREDPARGGDMSALLGAFESMKEEEFVFDELRGRAQFRTSMSSIHASALPET